MTIKQNFNLIQYCEQTNNIVSVCVRVCRSLRLRRVRVAHWSVRNALPPSSGIFTFANMVMFCVEVQSGVMLTSIRVCLT